MHHQPPLPRPPPLSGLQTQRCSLSALIYHVALRFKAMQHAIFSAWKTILPISKNPTFMRISEFRAEVFFISESSSGTPGAELANEGDDAA